MRDGRGAPWFFVSVASKGVMDGVGAGMGHGMERKRRALESAEAPPPGCTEVVK